MKIVHIASEMTPIAKVGGLGDVVYGLAKEQKAQGDKVQILLPGYTSINHELLDKGKEVKPGVVEAQIEKLPIVLLGKYDQIYGYDAVSEIRRFANFCFKVIAHLEDESFDIIHLHDWPVGLLAPMLKAKNPDIHIVLSIHNFSHQGQCKKEAVKDLDLPFDDLVDPHDADSINILKGALQSSDAIVAVSPKYAQEILTESGGAGLDQVLKQRQDVLTGILNGIDIDYWNPKDDPFLVYHYDMDNIDTALVGKESNRAHLYHELQMDRAKSPLVCAITRLVPQKGLDAIESSLISTLENGGNFMLLGSSPCPEIQSRFNDLAQKYKSPNLYCHFVFDEKLAHMVYASADMIIIPSEFEPCGLTQMIAMRYGTVPIVRCTGGLADTVQGGKNGFCCKNGSDFAETLSKAIDTYRNEPHIWKELILQGGTHDFSWEKSAKKYAEIYKSYF